MAHVLLVDDNEYVRVGTENLLRSMGHTVIVATNGEEALKYLKSHTEPCDLIISDYQMPEKNGLQFLEEARADYRFKKIPFILMSGNPAIENWLKEACDKMGATFSLKPSFDFMRLIHNALGSA